MNTTAELLETLYDVLRSHDVTASDVRIELDEDMGMWGVWIDDDLIGAAQCKSESLSEAVAQVRCWK